MKTEFIPERVRNAAINLDRMMGPEDMAAFNDLKPHWPDAGRFPLAIWVEQIVDDRRNAIVAHAEHLRMTFEDMAVSLKEIADKFETMDEDNAKNIKQALGELTGKIEDEWRDFDAVTEKTQGNYSDGGKHNAPPGDGYSNNLNNPIGK